MKNTLLIVVLIVLTSCQAYNGLLGEYAKITKDYRYNLKVNSDNSFAFERQSYHSRSMCNGKWELNGDTLLLKCDEEPLEAQLSSGYLTDREMEVIVLSDKKLKIGIVTMKQVKK